MLLFDWLLLMVERKLCILFSNWMKPVWLENLNPRHYFVFLSVFSVQFFYSDLFVELSTILIQCKSISQKMLHYVTHSTHIHDTS